MAEYIEREALMKNFCGYDLTKCVKYGNESAEQQHDSYSTMKMYEIADEIEDAPAADVAPVRNGRWVTPHWRNSDYCYNCSECGGEAMHREYQWARKGIYSICPNCGAKMDLEG